MKFCDGCGTMKGAMASHGPMMICKSWWTDVKKIIDGRRAAGMAKVDLVNIVRDYAIQKEGDQKYHLRGAPRVLWQKAWYRHAETGEDLREMIIKGLYLYLSRKP